jgi:hypothetical protein
MPESTGGAGSLIVRNTDEREPLHDAPFVCVTILARGVFIPPRVGRVDLPLLSVCALGRSANAYASERVRHDIASSVGKAERHRFPRHQCSGICGRLEMIITGLAVGTCAYLVSYFFLLPLPGCP